MSGYWCGFLPCSQECFQEGVGFGVDPELGEKDVSLQCSQLFGPHYWVGLLDEDVGDHGGRGRGCSFGCGGGDGH